MGEVYLAVDERLERQVALKVLPAGALAEQDARRRFRKEALALSRLNHPNIATVYDFDNQEGVDFLVMEYVPGQTLVEKLAGGALPEREVASLGMQIASALREAHEHDVVHRDLKPANIRLTSTGQVKVLDFGLAKMVRPAAGGSQAETVSQTRGAVGTLPYMPPEQLRGSAVDARADLFALGAVLYEMATGRRAFPQETGPRLTEAILHETPIAPRALNANVPADLERLILKCLEKDPEDRYQSAREAEVDLRRIAAPHGPIPLPPSRSRLGRGARAGLAGGAVLALAGALIGMNVGGWRDRLLGRSEPTRIDSLAVLPLENLSRDPEQEYFADGMTDALIANLAQIRSIRIISRTSVMRYKRTRKPVPEIGRELNVRAIVEGSVMRSGDRVRITSQLVEAATDRHLWAQTYERDLRDVLGLQSEVARAIASEIQATLTPREKDRLAHSRPLSSVAYDAYLRGRYYWNQRTTEAVGKGIELFEEAIAENPTYAPAYAGLADSYLVIGSPNLHPKERFEIARRAALKALELDPGLAEAYASLGEISAYFDWSMPEAERNYLRAIELNPNYATAHLWYGINLSLWGRQEEALREMEQARELDPLSLIIHALFGHIYYNARQYDRAIEHCLKTLEMDPDYPAVHLYLGRAYEAKGMYEEAVREFEKAMPSIGRPMSLVGGYAYARAGKRVEAMRLLHEMEQLSKTEYVSGVQKAFVYVGLGETDEALKYLSLAVEERAPGLTSLGTDPRLDPLRSDPRFADLKRRVGLWPE